MNGPPSVACTPDFFLVFLSHRLYSLHACTPRQNQAQLHVNGRLSRTIAKIVFNLLGANSAQSRTRKRPDHPKRLPTPPQPHLRPPSHLLHLPILHLRDLLDCVRLRCDRKLVTLTATSTVRICALRIRTTPPRLAPRCSRSRSCSGPRSL